MPVPYSFHSKVQEESIVWKNERIFSHILHANIFAYCYNNFVIYSDSDGMLPLWAKIAIETSRIIASVVLTTATGGAALPALLASLKFVAGSVAMSMAIEGVIGYLIGGVQGLKRGLLERAAGKTIPNSLKKNSIVQEAFKAALKAIAKGKI